MKKIFLIILIVAAQSCQGVVAHKIIYPDSSLTLGKSYDETWNKLVNWCSINKISCKCIDKTSGLINLVFDLSDIDSSKFSDYIIDDNLSSVDECYVNIYIIIKPSKDNTEVNIISHFDARELKTTFMGKGSFTKIETVNCKSTGKIEKEIFDYLKN